LLTLISSAKEIHSKAQQTEVLAKLKQLLEAINKSDLDNLLEAMVTAAITADYRNLDIVLGNLRAYFQDKKLSALTAELELVATPNHHTIEEVCDYLKLDIKQTVKAMLMNVDNELVILFIRGDRELNESKVLKLLGGKEIAFANDELIATSNAVAGYTGPVGLDAKIVVDAEVLNMTNFCCGANKEGYHYINANVKDFNYDIVGDIVNVKEGDICPKCGGKLVFKKGIEVGNTFKLGTKYSEAMNATFIDENGKNVPFVM
jgi:prolyl-tRNA synthetase